MPEPAEADNLERYSVSLVTQGDHRFYTLTMPSNVLASCCYITSRYDDAKEGFQRMLDKSRGQQIADYIDKGLGTIPNSIILSAQQDASLRIIGRGKTLEFRRSPKAFLILDGQHRVYGYSLAKNSLRVPVVIYNGLNKRDESRLFIDINTKQRPVPNELLLDIKKLAEYETDVEATLRELFDQFGTESASPLLGLMSPHDKKPGLISRVTFNAAVKPLMAPLSGYSNDEKYGILSSYVNAFLSGLSSLDQKTAVSNATVFRGMMGLFPEIATRVADKYGKAYTPDNFAGVLTPVFKKSYAALFKNPGTSHVILVDRLSAILKKSVSL